jgi:hypothetical protein
MMQLLFPKWFAAKQVEQTKRYDFDELYAQAVADLYESKRIYELNQYKDCDILGLANALATLHLIDENHTENITLIPDGIQMTYKYFNSESGDKACTAMLHGLSYDEKIYGRIHTPRVSFFIGDDVAILPALKIAIAEFKRQQIKCEKDNDIHAI